MTATAARPISRLAPLGVAAGFGAIAIAWRVAVELGSGAVLLAWLFWNGMDLQTLQDADLVALLPIAVIAAASIVQGVGMVGIAWGVSRAVRWPASAAFALRRPRVPAWVGGAVGGLTVGLFPGWVAWHLERLAPWLSLGNLDAIATALTTGGAAGRGLMVFAVVVTAPIVEELVFRGFLWNALERALPRPVVWVVTSALFAAYHIDPVHVIAVFFTGMFLGWLRLASRSVWPGVVAHFMNNLLGTVAVFALPDANDVVTPWWAAIGFALLTIALGALAALGRGRSDEVSSAPGAERG